MAQVPVYVDSNVMAGRAGSYDRAGETWSNVIYMPCVADNGFVPELPEETPEIIYLCFPNNFIRMGGTVSTHLFADRRKQIASRKLQIIFIQPKHKSTSPSYTVTAGPVM